MNLTKAEKETIITFDQEAKTAQVYTCDEKWKNDLDKLCRLDQRIVVDFKDENCKSYIIPKKAVKVRLSRILSEVKRQELSLRAKKNLVKRKN